MYGQRIRELRKEKKLTMKQFGEKFGLAESTISGYENETRKPDIELLEKFADYFDVKVDFLIGRDNEDPEESTLTGGRAFYGGGKDWTEEELEMADAFIKTLRARKGTDKK